MHILTFVHDTKTITTEEGNNVTDENIRKLEGVINYTNKACFVDKAGMTMGTVNSLIKSMKW